MSSLQQPVKKIKITTDYHIPIDKNNIISTSAVDSIVSNNNNINSSICSSSSVGTNSLSESIQILKLVNSIEMFSKFTLAKATDILLTAKKQNFSSGSIIIDLENNLPSNSLYIVVNGKISLFNKSSNPSSPKSTNGFDSNNPFNPPIETATAIPTFLNSSPNSIKKRKRENSFLKQQQQQLEEQIRTINNKDTTTIYRLTEEDDLEDLEDENENNEVVPHCCFQSGDHFCENSYPSNLFIAETDVELIKFNHNDFHFLFCGLS